ncbi:MAG: 4-alpha-glucanotransferase [Candidatus Omnitrophota bacterium]
MASVDYKNILLNTPVSGKWNKIGIKPRAGLAIALFSVYSKNSIGIGDLSDLNLLIDWAKQTGNSVVQLLPMNESGSAFCPYDALSSFALEPAYLSIKDVPGSESKTTKEKIRQVRELFPAGKSYVDYRVKTAKLSILADIFQQGIDEKDPALENFRRENGYWLEDFALFKVLKVCNQCKPWYEWTDALKNRREPELENFARAHEKEILFQVWVQWLIFKQLKQAKEYARKKNIFLKGDLPILVSRDSADVWSHPEFFKLDFAAGAPPDMYCAKGQRWGMPTYNWQQKAADEYRYLKERLIFAQNFYDLLRIDHVVGLFRIWSIPYSEPNENQGLNGFFDPSDESQWREHGKNILTVILNNSKMLLCAEDLGVIPPACTDTLRELGIPGNDVQRWVKDWVKRHDFLPAQEYRALSVAMLSTHDTTSWCAWWEYEAGTVDEALFIRKCSGRIDYTGVKDRLFDPAGCCHGRLRWLESVDSVEKLAVILGKRREEVADLADLYVNSFREKNKLWNLLGLKGVMREKTDPEIIGAALELTYNSAAIFCIQLMTDLLSLDTDILKGDSYQYRLNTPGTVSNKNWSLVYPISLEGLLKNKALSRKIKKLIIDSGRG